MAVLTLPLGPVSIAANAICYLRIASESQFCLQFEEVAELHFDGLTQMCCGLRAFSISNHNPLVCI